MVDKEVMVSICMITYNHEKYIAQAIESVLMQDLSYVYEIVIGEDYSTDSTLEICQSYAEKYPDRIRLLPSVTNLGAIPNFVRTLRQCKCQYIAFCEGDDYWTDPYKLQKQLDFLVMNPDYSICFHKVKILINNNLVDDFLTRDVPDTTDILDLAEGNYIHTPSVVFRNNLSLSENLLKEINNSFVGDYFLYMLNAKYGKIKKINDVMAIYRIHDASLHSSKPQNQKNDEWLTLLNKMIPYFDDKAKDVLANQYINLSTKVLTEGYISKKRGKQIVDQIKQLHSDFGFTASIKNYNQKGFMVFFKCYLLILLRYIKKLVKEIE